MKKFVGMTSALVLFAISAPAFASSESGVMNVVCRDARVDLADAGYIVQVASGSVSNQLKARVLETSIVGSKTLAVLPVQLNDRGIQRVYRGRGFSLTINLESMVATKDHPSLLSLGELKAKMICTILK